MKLHKDVVVLMRDIVGQFREEPLNQMKNLEKLVLEKEAFPVKIKMNDGQFAYGFDLYLPFNHPNPQIYHQEAVAFVQELDSYNMLKDDAGKEYGRC